MFVKIIDRAKGVAIAAGAASLLALAGVFLLAGSLAATLALWLPWPAALAIAAVIFLGVAGIAMWIGVQPDRLRTDESDSDHTDAALALVDLPMEAAKKIISERPIAAIVLASSLGLLIARRPQVAARMVDRILDRFS